MLQQTIAVFLVLGLLMGALWLLKRKGQAVFNISSLRVGKSGLGKRMRVVERVVLTTQHSLHLVSIDNRLILFATSPSGCLAVDQPAALGRAEADRGEAASC